MIFSEQLQAARNAAGLSQSQAALAIGRSASTLRKWEQGVNVPHATIQAVALAALKSAKRPKRNARLSYEECEKRVTQWEEELSAVMPADFKDWWQNDRSEWPLVARLVIESLRKREQLGPLSPLGVG